MKYRGQNEVAAQINSWRARCHILILIGSYDYKWFINPICYIVKTWVSLISIFNVKTRFKFDHLWPRKSDKDISSLKNHRRKTCSSGKFRQILSRDDTKCELTWPSASKSDFPHRSASRAKVNSRSSAQRWRFFKCVRRFEGNSAYWR